MVVTFSIAAIVAGAFVERTGIATPVLLVGTAIATTGTGLIYTWDLAPRLENGLAIKFSLPSVLLFHG
jgi:hypothetical protein